jgi:uncharacterized protein
MKAFVIDSFEFCRQKRRHADETPISELPRLAEESVDRSGMLTWSLQGGSDNRGNPELKLTVSGLVQLRCQRCLGAFPFEIDSESELVLAKDEANADELDALLADESVEVIVGSRAMDVTALIEDEALLALPLAPKHEVCPDQAHSDVQQDEKKESPFAVLKSLKQ